MAHRVNQHAQVNHQHPLQRVTLQRVFLQIQKIHAAHHIYVPRFQSPYRDHQYHPALLQFFLLAVNSVKAAQLTPHSLPALL